jgi:hypothetical protein
MRVSVGNKIPSSHGRPGMAPFGGAAIGILQTNKNNINL